MNTNCFFAATYIKNKSELQTHQIGFILKCKTWLTLNSNKYRTFTVCPKYVGCLRCFLYKNNWYENGKNVNKYDFTNNLVALTNLKYHVRSKELGNSKFSPRYWYQGKKKWKISYCEHFDWQRVFERLIICSMIKTSKKQTNNR